MKVLLVNTFDEGGGAAKAAFRINKGLRNRGIDSLMLVQFKVSDAEEVIEAGSSFEKMLRSLRPHLDAMVVRLYPNRPVVNFSPALLPDSLSRQVIRIDPDIIHLHWLAAGFIRLETLLRFTKPMIWTLHDSWAFTGGCHVPFDCTKYKQMCGSCPVLGSSHDDDLSRRVWRRKNEAWRNIAFAVVAPSRWLADCARSSSLFQGRRIEIIPNGLDMQCFKPADQRTARAKLSLPQDKKLILFGGVSMKDRNKGFHLLTPALRALSAGGWRDRTEIVVFGSYGPEKTLDVGMKDRYLGWLQKDASLALAYAAVDVCVVPSIQENLSNTVMESMACGTPCVAYNQGGMPELIEHKQNGFLARPFETTDLARGIAWVLEDRERFRALSQEARRKVEDEYDLGKIAGRYADLYKDMLRRKK